MDTLEQDLLKPEEMLTLKNLIFALALLIGIGLLVAGTVIYLWPAPKDCSFIPACQDIRLRPANCSSVSLCWGNDSTKLFSSIPLLIPGFFLLFFLFLSNLRKVKILQYVGIAGNVLSALVMIVIMPNLFRYGSLPFRALGIVEIVGFLCAIVSGLLRIADTQ